jgi:hypothetical protein
VVEIRDSAIVYSSFHRKGAKNAKGEKKAKGKVQKAKMVEFVDWTFECYRLQVAWGK